MISYDEYQDVLIFEIYFFFSDFFVHSFLSFSLGFELRQKKLVNAKHIRDRLPKLQRIKSLLNFSSLTLSA